MEEFDQDEMTAWAKSDGRALPAPYKQPEATTTMKSIVTQEQLDQFNAPSEAMTKAIHSRRPKQELQLRDLPRIIDERNRMVERKDQAEANAAEGKESLAEIKANKDRKQNALSSLLKTAEKNPRDEDIKARIQGVRHWLAQAEEELARVSSHISRKQAIVADLDKRIKAYDERYSADIKRLAALAKDLEGV